MDYIRGVVLENPEPTFEERWRRRIEALVAVVATFFGLLMLQWKVLNQNLWVGLGFAPLLHFGAFQLVSRVVSGRTFSFRLSPMARTPEEVLDLVFTVGFLFTLLVGCYTVWDSWSTPTPTIPLR